MERGHYKRISPRMWVLIGHPERVLWVERKEWKCGCYEYQRKKSCLHIRQLWEQLTEEKRRANEKEERETVPCVQEGH